LRLVLASLALGKAEAYFPTVKLATPLVDIGNEGTEVDILLFTHLRNLWHDNKLFYHKCRHKARNDGPAASLTFNTGAIYNEAERDH